MGLAGSERESAAAGHLEGMIRHRRHVHAHPEVGLALPDTHAYVAEELSRLGWTPEVRAGAGVSVRVEGTDRRGSVRVLRADMDALPLSEPDTLPFASRTPGAMHACGHDLHTAMLLGAAELFAAQPPRHTVVLAFQPGEESDRGALRLLEHDNLQLTGDVAAFALHVNAVIPTGELHSRPGVFMAAGDWFAVSFASRGGHASAPHLVANPTVAAAEWTLGAARAVSELAGREALVATVTHVASGNTVNVIPTTGLVRGTLRTLSGGQRDALAQRLRLLTAAIACTPGLEARLEITPGYPALVNDAAFLTAVSQALATEGASHQLSVMPSPSMVIEDFSYFALRWPAAMIYLGAQSGASTAFNHSEEVLFDEDAMVTGLALMSLVADGPR